LLQSLWHVPAATTGISTPLASLMLGTDAIAEARLAAPEAGEDEPQLSKAREHAARDRR